MSKFEMNDHSLTLFSALLVNASLDADEMAQEVRALLPKDLLKTLGKEFHIALRKTCQKKALTAVYSVLKPLDNVGCTLPEGTLGFTILARVQNGDDVIEVPVKERDEDLADMWLGFVDDVKESMSKS